MNKLTSSKAGVSIFEVVVAAAILVVAVTGLYALYCQSMRAMKTTTNTTVVQTFLRGQIEQLRNCKWTILSGSNSSLPVSILPDPTTDSMLVNLLGVTQEKISVYPVLNSATAFPTPTPYYTVTRANPTMSLRKKIYKDPTLGPAITGSQTALTFVVNITGTSQGMNYTREYSAVLTQQANP